MSFYFRFLVFITVFFSYTASVHADIHSTQEKLAKSHLLQQVVDKNKTPYAEYVLHQSGIKGLYLAIHPVSQNAHFFVTENVTHAYENRTWYQLDNQSPTMKRVDVSTAKTLNQQYFESTIGKLRPLVTFAGSQAKKEPLYLLLPYPCTTVTCETFIQALSTLEQKKKLARSIRVLAFIPDASSDIEFASDQLNLLSCANLKKEQILARLAPGERAMPALPESNCSDFSYSKNVRLFDKIFQASENYAALLDFQADLSTTVFALDESQMATTLQRLLLQLSSY